MKQGDPMNFEDVKKYLAYRINIDATNTKSWLAFLRVRRQLGFMLFTDDLKAMSFPKT